jgi:hypothetical protein
MDGAIQEKEARQTTNQQVVNRHMMRDEMM